MVGTGELLYITPVAPSITGSGTPMRAGMVLEALCACYRVSLLIVPHAGYSGDYRSVHPDLAGHCEDVRIVPLEAEHNVRVEQARDAYRDRTFDVVHVFRLGTMPFAWHYLRDVQPRPGCHLDLDDIESKTRRRIASLYRGLGHPLRAAAESKDANRLALLEAVAFREFDRIYVCSESDRAEVANRGRAEVCVLRNAVRPPAVVQPPTSRGEFRFLFVGTLGYYPNEDAVRYFCTQVLPLIRERSTRKVRVCIVGSSPSKDLISLGAADVEVVGQAPDLEIWYRSCHAAIVPLRAGGGTRIKILEAFSYGRPVVTTSVGVEGIDAIPNRHVLIGDTPEAFADACVRLISDEALRRELVENARRLLHEQHMPEMVKSTLKPSATCRISDISGRA